MTKEKKINPIDLTISVASVVLTFLPGHAFKLLPMTENDLLDVVRELAEHRRPKYGQMD